MRLSRRKRINRLIFASDPTVIRFRGVPDAPEDLKLIVYQSSDIGSRPKLTNTFVAHASAGSRLFNVMH